MNVWGILVNYNNIRKTNINEAYKTYVEAKKAIMNKIGNNETTTINEYTFYDLNENITYELKSITIN